MAIIHQLIMRSGPTPGKEFPLESVETHIGRDVDNDIVINDAEVSRHHARISLQMENYILEDKGSTNGTSVNGRRITAPYTLHSGDVITFGEHVDLLYEGGVDPNATVIVHTGDQAEGEKPSTMMNQAFETPIPREEFETENPPEPKKIPWVILILIVVLLIVCVCGVSLYLIDTNNMWCSLFPFLFPACTAGV